MSVSDGKRKHLEALSDERGVIAAAAMDQRGNLRKMIADAKGIDAGEVTAEMMAEFKAAVTRVLSPYASAILLDPEYGLEAAAQRSQNTGLLLAYEKSGYDNRRRGRLPDLLDEVSVRRIVNWGANAVKILMHYSPFEDPKINEIKHAFVERVGAECEAYQIPFFLEPVGYDPGGGDEKGFEYAKRKPEVVTKTIAELTQAQYKVDVLKVEVPVNTKYMEGGVAYCGQKAYSKAEALEHFRAAAGAATKPFIYLSAGVSNEQFVESLELAGEAGVDYSGVLCGRATWKDGVPVYATKGLAALEGWLAKDGVRNIRKVNDALKTAKPWYVKLGVEGPAA